MVELNEKGNVKITELPLKPLRNVTILKGKIDELLTNPSEINENFVYVVLTDETIVPYAMKRIRVKYPNAISLTYDNLLKNIENKVIVKSIEFDYKKGIECILKKTKEARCLGGNKIAFYSTPLEV